MSFPKGGNSGLGTNFQTMSPALTRASTTSTSYVTALSVRGSGLITSIVQAGSGAASMRVTVDGQIIYDGSFSAANPTSLNALFPFHQSFLVEHSAAPSQSANTTIAYLLN